MRDEIVDYIGRWTGRTELSARKVLGWLGLGTSKFYDWRKRYGQTNEHNSQVPRDFWLEDWEKQAILDFHDRHPLEGYRTLTFMMLDDDVVAVSPSSVYRVLKAAGRLDRRRFSPSKKGTGFVQPKRAHAHWHIDISYINVAGTCGPAPTIRNPTGNSNAGTKASNASASGRLRLLRSRKRSGASGPMWNITTTSACTAPWGISRRPISSTAWKT